MVRLQLLLCSCVFIAGHVKVVHANRSVLPCESECSECTNYHHMPSPLIDLIDSGTLELKNNDFYYCDITGQYSG